MVESQAVDIVITDVKMPGVDGFEVLRRVRSVAPETEVIVITGVKEAENAFRALREGAFDFFNKPFKVEEIDAAIRRTGALPGASQREGQGAGEVGPV